MSFPLVGGEAHAQDVVNLRLQGVADCDNQTYCATLQIQAASDSFRIGTSSILLNYNASALTFSSYTSSNFDGSGLCIAGVANAWDAQAFDGTSVPGSFNLTMTLLNNGFSCPDIVSGSWIDIGTVCFTLVDPNTPADPQLSFDLTNTNFNRNSPNDGTRAIAKGTFEGINTPIDCSCPPAGTACDDMDPLTINDAYDANCNCVGTPCPPAGTACDDMDPLTINDAYDANCNCVGTPCPPAGTACDDMDPLTINDTYDANCNCVGTPCPPAGTVCDDMDPLTINDAYDANCNCVGTPAGPQNDEVNLQLTPVLDCNASTYCVTIQLQATADSFRIGTSSILMTYDPAVLSFSGYTSLGFDGSDLCIGGVANAWDSQVFDGSSVPGNFNLTMTLLNNGFSCPDITSGSWVDVGELCFTVLQPQGNPQLAFDNPNTNFNRHTPNDGTQAIAKGTFTGITAPLNCSCPPAGTACDDMDPLTINDAYDANCNCVGTPCPPAGTACDDMDPLTINDAYDANCNCVGTPCPPAGTACDDMDPLTINDAYDANCNCVGTPCPPAGTACDDMDPLTINDAYDANCNCVGTPCPPAGTACDDMDPLTINDAYDANCNCVGTPCPPAGTACDDMDPLTINDAYDANCNCVGTPCPPAGTACDDMDPLTINDAYDANCNCVGTPCPPAGTACDDMDPLTINDAYDANCNCVGTPCPPAGTACDDMDPLTINDAYDANCNCVGTPCPPAGTACDDMDPLTINDAYDANCNCVGTPCPPAGTACDDMDPLTINDVYNANCNCVGTPCPPAGTACDDMDPLTINDAYDANCNCVGTPCPPAGTACDDMDPLTINDVYNANCNCVGTPCPPAGTACDDMDPLTINDAYDANCNCVGTPCPPAGTACDDMDPLTINDTYDANCNCAGTPCPPAGTACDDMDPLTINDTYDANCNCVGTPCPPAGTVCDDMDPLTINDAYDANCNCVGTPTGPQVDAANLRLVPTLNCDSSLYCVTLQIQAESDSFRIGTSSLFLTYDEQVIAFNRYTSLAFDGSALCIGGVANAWEPHAFDGTSVPGNFNLTMTLLNDEFSCPEIASDAWVSIGELCFDVLTSGNPQLAFDPGNTNFNRHTPNDGTQAIAQGTFTGIDSVLDCQSCPPVGTACDDMDPLTINDVYDANCNCVGTPCPPAGTACDDGDPLTIDDVYDANCNCVGTPCPPAGTACDDGDPLTIDDVYDANCNCVGTPCPPAGTACDDGDPLTIDDVYDANCNCVGTPCPPAGTACDDGNPNTFGDSYDSNCLCIGTPVNDCQSEGELRYERWLGLEGNSLETLRSSPDFPNYPSTRLALTDYFRAPQNVTNSYGVRISALLCPPISGEYVFWISGDDEVELWLSSDFSSTNTALIAFHTGTTEPEEWEKYGSQKSAPIALEAGQQYYVEAFLKDNNGTDHLSVGWMRPDQSLERPIPAAYFSPPPDVFVIEPQCARPAISGLSANPDKGGVVTLNWNSQSQQAYTFVVEKSFDGANFQEVGRINGDPQTMAYSLRDTTYMRDRNFYRIRQQNAMGVVCVSNLILATYASYLFLDVYPNPSAGDVTFSVKAGEGGTGRIHIVDATGRLIEERDIEFEEGTQLFHYDLSHLAKGIYNVQLEGLGVNRVRRWVRQ